MDLNQEVVRDQVREAVLDYMQRNNIGVIKLVSHILEATGSKLSYRTVGRFLANKHRTHDECVEVCARFIQRAEKGGLAAAFARAARAFYAGESAKDAVYRTSWDGGESILTISGPTVHEATEINGRRRDFVGAVVWNPRIIVILLRDKIYFSPKTYHVNAQGGRLTQGNGMMNDPINSIVQLITAKFMEVSDARQKAG